MEASLHSQMWGLSGGWGSLESLLLSRHPITTSPALLWVAPCRPVAVVHGAACTPALTAGEAGNSLEAEDRQMRELGGTRGSKPSVSSPSP